MTTQYTPILKLALPVQGELSGTWGDVVNDNITSMIEQAIAGRLVINTWSGNSHTLTIANGTTAEARAAMLSLTDSNTQLGAAGTVVCPALSKTYIVKNGAGQIITVKTASGSGIAIPNGKTMLVYCDGTNVLEGVDHVVTLSAGTLTITGLTTFASLKGADATTVTGILDEDNMASNSATKLVTQQSVKAYVDSQVGSFDTLAEVLAGGNTTGSNDIDVDAAQKVQFRDAAIYINSSADGQLDIVADTEIQIAAATVDLNGNLDVSGTALVTGTLDVDGATQLDSTLTVGVNDTGHDVKFFGASSGSYMLWDESADDLILGGAAGLSVAGASTLTGVLTANAGVVVDNITIDGQEIDVSSGDLTLDVAGDIILDADGGSLVFRDSGTTIAQFDNASSNLQIISMVQDKDIVLRGNDGGSFVNALTLDMSAAGAATFNSSVTATGLTVNSNEDQQLTLNSTDSSAVYAAFKREGVRKAYVGYGASNSNFQIANEISDGDIQLLGNDGGSTVTALTLDMSAAGAATFNSSVTATSLDISGNIDVDGVTNLDATNIVGALDVTGTATMDGLTVDTAQGSISIPTNTSSLNFNRAGSSYIRATDSAGSFTFITGANNFATQRLNIANNGDISFYEDTGSTAKFVWDASAESLAIGTSTPVSTLEISKSDQTNGATLSITNAFEGGSWDVGDTVGTINFRIDDTSTTQPIRGQIKVFDDAASGSTYPYANAMSFSTGSVNTLNERFRISSDGSLSTPTLGTSNVRFGVNAGNSIVSGGNYNTVVGDEAGTAITTGDYNTGIGYSALKNNSTGNENVALGRYALFSSTTAIYNTAVGTNSLQHNTTGSNNTALGRSALIANTTASNNTAVGYASLGANTTGISNVSLGAYSLDAETTGSYSVAVGFQALTTQNSTSSGAMFNTAVGTEAGKLITTGIQNTLIGSLAGDALTSSAGNVAVGYLSLSAATTADLNTAIGHRALTTNILSDRNVALGYAALSTHNLASNGDGYNVAVGYNAGAAVTTGVNNTLIGGLAGDAITTANDNIAMGYQSLSDNTTGANNVALGTNALANNTSAASNVAVGYSSLYTNTTGAQNTAVGLNALWSNTTGASNVAIGYGALDANTTASNNTALGYASLGANITGGNNTSVGLNSMLLNTTGASNVSLGAYALDANTTASNNVAVGYSSLGANTTGTENIAVGHNALVVNTTGSYNTAVGGFALDANTTAANNTAIGHASLGANTTGAQNVAVGTYSLDANTTANNNTAVGYASLGANTTGNSNVAVGYSSLGSDTLGDRAVAIGLNALASQNFTSSTDNYNIGIGYGAGYAVTIGVDNTLIGGLAGDSITTGNRNTILGYNSANSLTDGSDNVALGNQVEVAASVANTITLGSGISATGSNDFSFGKASNVVTNDFDADANWSRSSDERLKKNIVNQSLGLDFINDLRTVKYNWKPNNELDASDAQLAHLRRQDADGNVINDMNTTVTMHNFIAQEVKTALDTAGVSSFGGWKEDDFGVQQVSREMFVIPLVKAVQELSTQLDAALARITTLEG